MESNVTTVNGIRRRWEEQGQGQPVVFLHGIPTDPSLWRHVMPRVHGARTLAWEMVGYGESIPEGQGRDISVARQAEYLASWMRELGLGRAVVVGHDLGGGVAQILAVRHPDLVAGLVLMNAISYDSWPIPMVKAMRAASGVVERLPDAVFKLVMQSFLMMGHDQGSKAREAFKHHWPHYQRHGGAAAFIRQVRSLNVRDTLEISDQISYNFV